MPDHQSPESAALRSALQRIASMPSVVGDEFFKMETHAACFFEARQIARGALSPRCGGCGLQSKDRAAHLPQCSWLDFDDQGQRTDALKEAPQ